MREGGSGKGKEHTRIERRWMYTKKEKKKRQEKKKKKIWDMVWV